jgi:quercetin dioxygenase-like cupin family protein
LTDTGSATVSNPANESILSEATIKTDTTIKKVEASSLPRGEMAQKYLVAGKRVSMRLWIDEPGGKLKAPTARDYETVGYVISGSARLDLEGQTLNLKAGDSWLVPAGAMHQYTIINPFTAVEATAPPAEAATHRPSDTVPAIESTLGQMRTLAKPPVLPLLALTRICSLPV